MDPLSKIEDTGAQNETNEQRKNGFVIRDSKYLSTRDDNGEEKTKELSNFVMKSLFHLVNGTNNSKRIIKLQRNTGEICIVEVFSSEMKPETFETILKSKRCTFYGSNFQLKRIFGHLMDEETEAIIMGSLGWNGEHQAYVFADAMYIDNRVIGIDSIGIVEAANKRFYLPAFGLANDGSDDLITDRLYKFKPGKIGFTKWAELFFTAFGTNGAIGILFLILAIYRDIVFSQVRFLPFLFLFGDAGTGKTSYVERLLNLFGADIIGTPLLNVSSVGMSRLANSRVNGLCYFKEYTSETDEKAQDFVLTAYDGAGRTTGIKSNDSRTKSFPVRSAIVFDGNNLPTQKAAILSRMILLDFQDSNFTNEQKEAYNTLKALSDDGLGNVLVEILSKRPQFENKFKETFAINTSELSSLYGKTFPERTLNHIAMLVAPAKILWDDLYFPFDPKSVIRAIIENAENQNNLLKESGAISIFWEAFSHSLKKGLVVPFNGLNLNTANFNIKNIDNETGIIQIKLRNLYPYYVRYCRDNNIQFLDQNSLKMILTSKSNLQFLPSSQKGRALASDDDNFRSCYKFSFIRKGDSIIISNVEICL
jgi:hypothetical protein